MSAILTLGIVQVVESSTEPAARASWLPNRADARPLVAPGNRLREAGGSTPPPQRARSSRPVWRCRPAIDIRIAASIRASKSTSRLECFSASRMAKLPRFARIQQYLSASDMDDAGRAGVAVCVAYRSCRRRSRSCTPASGTVASAAGAHSASWFTGISIQCGR